MGNYRKRILDPIQDCEFVHFPVRSTINWGAQEEKPVFFRFAKQIGERNSFKTFFNSFAQEKTLFTINPSLRLFIYHCNSKEKIIHYDQTFRQFEPLFLNWSNVGGHIQKLVIFTYFTKFFDFNPFNNCPFFLLIVL